MQNVSLHIIRQNDRKEESFMPHEFQLVAAALVIMLIAVMVVTLLGRILQSIFLAILVVAAVCIGFTVFFGDGRGIVYTFTSFLNEDVGQKIEEGYEYYKAKEEQDQYIDPDKVTDSATNVFNEAKEKVKIFKGE